ncbi:NAD(P)H-dependent oxidoreductase [Gracilinema caldarium]|uniref:NAD(P)H-dependent oxidoreductase n=1 Tax=Gracilinema caldarium TaxID=215591 RepID=UPI0026EFFF1B|nr:NAD(P)H-dependent oxidoreductase [Gracilinema caldarium]
MMRVLIVLAYPKKEGFNRAIAREVQKYFQKDSSVTSTFVDLYADRFDPVLSEDEIPRKFSFDETTLRYQQYIKDADRVVFIHPDWWGGPPAILKGFLDRVFRPGVAYGFREADFRNADTPGLFTDKRFDVFITTDAHNPDADNPNPQSANSVTASLSWSPARVWKEQVLDFCGARDIRIHVFWNLRGSSYAERKMYLDSIQSRMV